jgi:hypothetical protein
LDDPDSLLLGGKGRKPPYVHQPPSRLAKRIETVFLKVDAYDRDLRFSSEDPTNPAVTRRALTIMLVSEY